MWNFVSAAFWSSVNELRVPVLRSEKAVSVGANMVNPALAFFLSSLLICESIWVLFNSPIKVLNLRAFLRIPMMSAEAEEDEGTKGPEGDGAGGEED